MAEQDGLPNPNRVAAGKRNAMKRVGFTEEGLARMRAAALVTQPWRHSTGPRTAEGKSRSSANGRTRQVGDRSKRSIRRELAAVAGVCETISKLRAAMSSAR
jgi:hypothetical protein